MNTVTLNGRAIKVPSTFDELRPNQFKQLVRILGMNYEYKWSALNILIVLFPKTDLLLQWQLARCSLINVPFFNRFAYGGILLEHMKQMFVLTDFILKPLPADWTDKLTWGQYVMLAENYVKLNIDSEAATTLFMSTMVDLCDAKFRALPWHKNAWIQNEFVREYVMFMDILATRGKFKRFFSGGKGKAPAFGYHEITDELAKSPDRIQNIESATALNTIVHIERLLEKNENFEKASKR